MEPKGQSRRCRVFR